MTILLDVEEIITFVHDHRIQALDFFREPVDPESSQNIARAGGIVLFATEAILNGSSLPPIDLLVQASNW